MCIERLIGAHAPVRPGTRGGAHLFLPGCLAVKSNTLKRARSQCSTASPVHSALFLSPPAVRDRHAGHQLQRQRGGPQGPHPAQGQGHARQTRGGRGGGVHGPGGWLLQQAAHCHAVWWQRARVQRQEHPGVHDGAGQQARQVQRHRRRGRRGAARPTRAVQATLAAGRKL